MLKLISKKIGNFLLQGIEYEENECETVCYGIELAIYSIISTAALLIVAALFHSFVPALFIIFVFYVNQTIGGGIHMNTHLKCFLLMLFGMGIGLLLSKINMYVLWLIILFVCIILLYLNPLVLHKNKTYLIHKREALIRKSRTIIAVEGCLLIILFIMKSDIFIPCVAAILLSAISRTCAKYCVR